jgi:glycosyltransferase involved in cell wall biosynthesis
MNFASGLRALGHQVKVAGPEDCIFWPKQRKAKAFRITLGMWRAAVRLTREFHPDVIEFYGAESWLAIEWLRRKKGRHYKLVAHSNGIEPFVEETLARHGINNTFDGKPPRWYQSRLRLPLDRAFSHADAIVTVSQADRGYALRRGYQHPDRILALDNGLPDDFLDQPFFAERPKTIGFCGSWTGKKGAALISKDIAAVLRNSPDWKFHLVGVGNDFRVEDHFPADVLPRLTVTNFVTDKTELRRIYQSWAIAIMPSIYESFGLVAAEAMACGCALVATRTGFAASLKDEEEALILDRPASPLLEEAVLRLVVNEHLRYRLAQCGYRRTKRLQWDANTAELAKFYQTLIGGGSTPGM